MRRGRRWGSSRSTRHGEAHRTPPRLAAVGRSHVKNSLVSFSPYKIFFRKIRFGTRSPGAGFWTRFGSQGTWGAASRRWAAVAPAGASEGARGPVQGSYRKKWRNRRVS